ncbi:substrate-binding domain-containing protein [Streptomyces sp. NPDC052109]|uniref:substrate-binding domain-containing protein n=1 Tax=Streptomyces sp. NPDC052109 TaxID=3155527 RepID=UPI003417B985
MQHLVEPGHREIVHIDGEAAPVPPSAAPTGRRCAGTGYRPSSASPPAPTPGDPPSRRAASCSPSGMPERPCPRPSSPGSDRGAMGLSTAPARVGAEVPRGLSVVGYDPSHPFRLMPSGLTAVRQGARLMTEHAVRFAVQRLEDPELAPREAGLDPKLVVRGTNGTSPARNRRGGGQAACRARALTS